MSPLGRVSRWFHAESTPYYPEYWNGTYQGDELFLDFGLSIGDTIAKDAGYYLVAIDIDSISLGSEYLRRIHYKRWTSIAYPSLDTGLYVQAYDINIGMPNQLCGNYSHPSSFSPIIFILNGDTMFSKE